MKISESLGGSVLAYSNDGAAHFLKAGDEIPRGVRVDSSLIEAQGKPEQRKKRKSIAHGGNESK